MTTSLTHRGPDDSGFQSWSVGANVVVFGHTRLSILDLSASGRQPMAEQSGRYSTVFNGEIYNFRELRKLLDPEGGLFRTSTDTEVILHSYHRWSENAFRTFRGMFAFALFDKQTCTVRLVRDSLGIKPLYYYISGDTLLFASELRALLASGQIERRIDTEALSHFLSWGWVGESGTVISGIKVLQPGEMLTVDLSGERPSSTLSRYLPDSSFEVCGRGSDRNENTGHMLHLLEQSVKSHLVSDVAVGLFLSGGIDSTALLHLMRQAGCNNPKTFTVVFPDKRFDESRFAKLTAQRFEAEHHEIHLGESDLLRQLPSALSSMDQPTMDGVNTFIISKAVRSSGVKVALSGLGADELFAGYPSFRRARWAKSLARVPQPVRATLASSCRKLNFSPRSEKVWDLLGSDCTPVSAYRISRRLFGPTEIGALLPGCNGFDELHSSPASGDEINEITRLEMGGYMTNLLLRDTDFMSMANSLEVRVPFIDRAVVNYVLGLPGRWKLNSSIPKAFLLETMKGAVPKYIWNRPKMGFVFPLERWMRNALRAQMEETFTDRRTAESLGFSPGAVKQVWRDFLNGTSRWSKPWSLFVLLRWCERQGASV